MGKVYKTHADLNAFAISSPAHDFTLKYLGNPVAARSSCATGTTMSPTLPLWTSIAYTPDGQMIARIPLI